MAELGFSLKGGDPELIERVQTQEEQIAEPQSERTPSEVRHDLALALIDLGSAFGRDGPDLVKYGAQLLTRPEDGKANIRRTLTMLKQYVGNHERPGIYAIIVNEALEHGLDIYRSASVLIREHGEGAALEVAQSADAVLEKGSLDGQRVWKQILAAVKEIQRQEKAR